MPVHSIRSLIVFVSLQHYTGGLKLEYNLFGKPEASTYNYAERMLLNQKQQLMQHTKDELKPLRIYGVGDNPRSGIYVLHMLLILLEIVFVYFHIILCLPT